MKSDFQADIENVSRITAVPTILEVICRTTGMGFAAVARVTHDRWVACSVLDEIDFGLRPGGELKVETTICDEIRRNGHYVVIDHVAEDCEERHHAIAARYGFQSYISVPIVLADGSFFGTLCAIDPQPARVKTPEVIGMFRLFAELVAKHLDARIKLVATESALDLAHKTMESNPDCVTVIDLAGDVLSVNRNGCGFMELEDQSSITHKPWLKLWEGPEVERASTAFETARTGNQARFNGYFRTATGKRKYLEVVLSPIHDTTGKPDRILIISRDMTIRRVEEAQLRETAKLESIGVLAGGIAHDFNNLLTGVLGNASLLEMTANPRERAIAGEIVEAAQRAADLTRQILAYSGTGRFLVDRMNLSTVIQEILGLARTTIDKKVQLVVSLHEDLPLIEADFGQMQQLVLNLILNASESLEGRAGKITVSTSLAELDHSVTAQTFRSDQSSISPGRYVCIEVRDTGSGMSEQTLSKIFDPFFTTRFTGRGLGLAAVAGILRGHSGAVRIESHLGEGTVFSVFLPAAPDLPEGHLFGESGLDSSDHLGWGTILLVDDEAIVGEAAQVALQQFGYRVLLAENGQQAVEIFKERRAIIRLIVLDWRMPVMDGEEALAVLRQEDNSIPILISSGYDSEEVVNRFTVKQVNGCIQKPYTAQQLNDAIAKALLDSHQN